MSSQRIFALALVILGAILLGIGMNSSHSFTDQLSNTFTGHFTDNTTWYLIGGIASGLVGVSMFLFGPRGTQA